MSHGMQTGALSRGRSSRLRTVLGLAVLAAALTTLALGAGAASAAFTATGWSVTPSALQAGAHPTVSIKAATDPVAADLTGDDLSSLQMDLPAGLLMNPQAVGTPCPAANFSSDSCAPATQVGSISVSYRVSGRLYSSSGAVYSIAPDANSVINFGFVVRPNGFQKFLFRSGRATGLATVRQGLDKDYGLSILVPGLPRTIKSTLGLSASMTIANIQIDFFPRSGSTQTGPYFTYAPTRCDAANSRATFTSYAGVTQSLSAGFVPTGCDQLKFEPGFALSPATTAAGQPTGISATVTMPAAEQPVQQSHMRDIEVTLPSGTTINLANLNAVTLCPEAQLAADACPAASRIGSATVNVPMLPAPMTGDIYLTSRDTVQFGYVLRGARGTLAILRGSAAPGAGGIVATFQTLPQVPWSSATLNFTSQLVNNPRNSCPYGTAWADMTGYTGSRMIAGSLYPLTACPPETTITASPSSPTNSRTPSFSFSSPAAGAGFECSVDNAAFAACASPYATPSLAEGSHSFAVRATSGGVADPTPATQSFVVDVTPPPIAISSPAAGATLSSADLTLQFTTETGAADYCRLDSGAIVTCTSPRTYAGLADGDHKVQVISRDTAANIATRTVNFKVATIKPPVVTINAPADGATLATNRLPLDFAATSPNGVAITKIHCSFYYPYPEFGFEIDAFDRDCANGDVLRLDEDTRYRMQIDVTDANGSVGSASVTFVAGIYPPFAPRVTNSVAAGRVSDRTPEFQLEPTDGRYPDAVWECAIAPKGAQPGWAPCGGEQDVQTYQVSDPLTDGGWTFWTRSSSGAIVGDAWRMDFTVGDWDAVWTATASTRQAGAHPDLDIDITPTGAGQFHTVDVTLPKGLIGSLNSFPKCPPENTWDASCDPSTKIGTVDVDYQIAGVENLKPTDGDVYLTEPQTPDDAAGMVIRVYAPIRPFADVIIPLRLQLIDNVQRMRVFSEDIPTVVGDVYDPSVFTNFWVNDFKMHINGSAGSPYPLLTNPSRCAAGEFTGSFGDTEGATTPPQPIAHQAEDCDALPFEPSIAQTFSSLAAGTRSGVTTDLTLPQGSASIKTVSVAEPVNMAPNLASFGAAGDRCPGSAAPDETGRFDESQCPPSSLIGTISVDTPLLPAPLEGNVYLVNKTPLPWLGVALDGQGIRARFYGATDLVKADPACGVANPNQFCQKRVSVTFDDMPDLPLTAIHLDLNKPDRPSSSGSMLTSKLFSLVANGDSACAPTGSVDSSFATGGGAPQVTAKQVVPISGC